jgi:hypothetical protein
MSAGVQKQSVHYVNHEPWQLRFCMGQGILLELNADLLPKANLVLREYLTQAVDGHRESHSDLPVLRVVARHDSQCALTIARMSDENLKFWNEVRERR